MEKSWGLNLSCLREQLVSNSYSLYWIMIHKIISINSTNNSNIIRLSGSNALWTVKYSTLILSKKKEKEQPKTLSKNFSKKWKKVRHLSEMHVHDPSSIRRGRDSSFVSRGLGHVFQTEGGGVYKPHGSRGEKAPAGGCIIIRRR